MHQAHDNLAGRHRIGPSADAATKTRSQDAETVLTNDEIDRTTLAEYLRGRLPACGLDARDLASEIVVTRFSGGHSNLTYLVRFGGIELVMRRPPLGPLPPAAHNVAREYRWLAALNPVFPLVPRPYLLCDDIAIAGSIFYVMERRHGVILRHEEPQDLIDRPDRRRQVSEALVDSLADLHAVDIQANGLSALGKPHGFVTRQVRGWTDRWYRSQTTPLPEIEAVARWIGDHLPREPATASIVHGDFKLDNVMLDPDHLGKVVAILDWEMSALGDPLVDLGILLAYWAPTAPPGHDDASQAFRERPGWLSRQDIIERYAARSKRDVTGIQFYEVFAIFKVAVVIQQIFHRYSRGDATDPRFARFDARVAYLARRAADRIEQG